MLPLRSNFISKPILESIYMFQEASIFYIHTHYTVYNACIVCVQLEDHRQDDVFQLQTDINSLRLG